MKELSPEMMALLRYLLPGFVARWVFHGLTAHKRTEAFERVVEALIFTAIIQAIMPPLRDSLLGVGAWFTPYFRFLPSWHAEYEFTYTLIVSFAVGIVAAGFANNDFFHRWLRNRHLWLCRHAEAEQWSFRAWRWTKRTSLPTQWYSMFSTQGAWVVLQLDDDRRLYGWALEWPDHPDEGHFSMCNAEWLVGNERHKVENTEAILVSVKNVKMVQFASVSEADEQAASDPGWIKRVLSRFANGNRSTTTAAANSKQAATAVSATATALAESAAAGCATTTTKQVNKPNSQRKKRGKRR